MFVQEFYNTVYNINLTYLSQGWVWKFSWPLLLSWPSPTPWPFIPMKDDMPGTLSTSDPLETGARMLISVTDRDNVLPNNGVKEPPDPPKTPTISMMKPWQETRAPDWSQTRTTPTETTFVTERGPALPLDGAKEPQDHEQHDSSKKIKS